MSEEPAERRLPVVRLAGAGRALVVAASVAIVIAALRLASAVLLPLVGGLFLAVLARPAHCRIRDALPVRLRWLGLVGAMLGVVAVVAAFAAAIGWSARAVVQEVDARRPQIEARLERVREMAARIGVTTSSLQSDQSDAPAPGEPRGEGAAAAGEAAPSGLGQRLTRALVAGLGGLALALGFAALGLAEADDARRRIEDAASGAGRRRALAAIDEATTAFRRYVWVKSLTSAITGVASALLALAFGLPLAWVWGLVAFLLEYVPTVGSMLAVIPPTLMALAEGGGLARPTLVLVSYSVMQIVLGNVLDPRIEGRLMSISPFVVLLSIVFWGWLWGPVGALLAVPLTVAVVIVSRHAPSGSALATLLAGDDARAREDR
jgi:predicted PurR-regulated permease PerM